MRLMLDTCVIIDLLTDVESLSKSVLDILGDTENTLYASAESMALMSSDTKFPFYRNQGLELIEY